jgi:predicted O-methyltransferase YrrM
VALLQSILQLAYRGVFDLGERLGVHVTPNHFYWPIPDTRRLPESLWTRPGEMPGVDLREDEQLKLLEELARFRAEYDAFPRQPTGDPSQFHLENERFCAVDAELYYAFIRLHRPRRIVEIGSGFSTLVAAEAVRRNAAEGNPCALTCIEPYPSPALRRGVAGVAELIVAPVQEVPMSRFTGLGANDVLFVDSTHVLKTGSDVQLEYLEILPRLAIGVLVQIHDIFLPMEYPRGWLVKNKWFWNEQYLLQAFLAFNSAFRVRLMASLLQQRHPARLQATFGSFDPKQHQPASCWIQRVA